MHEVVAMRFSMCMVCLSCNSVFGVDYPVRVCLEECFFFAVTTGPATFASAPHSRCFDEPELWIRGQLYCCSNFGSLVCIFGWGRNCRWVHLKEIQLQVIFSISGFFFFFYVVNLLIVKPYFDRVYFCGCSQMLFNQTLRLISLVTIRKMSAPICHLPSNLAACLQIEKEVSVKTMTTTLLARPCKLLLASGWLTSSVRVVFPHLTETTSPKG